MLAGADGPHAITARIAAINREIDIETEVFVFGGQARFIQVWRRVDGRWLAERVISYDHRPAD